jgi:hypothetical protein
MHDHQSLSEPEARAQARAVRELSTSELHRLARVLADATNLRRVARSIVADLQHQLSGTRQRAVLRGTNAN